MMQDVDDDSAQESLPGDCPQSFDPFQIIRCLAEEQVLARFYLSAPCKNLLQIDNFFLPSFGTSFLVFGMVYLVFGMVYLVFGMVYLYTNHNWFCDVIFDMWDVRFCTWKCCNWYLECCIQYLKRCIWYFRLCIWYLGWHI